MKVTFIPIIISAFGTIIEGLLKGLEDLEIRGRVETIQTTTLLISVKILRGVLETCCHSNFSERPSTNADVKNSQEVTIMIILMKMKITPKEQKWTNPNLDSKYIVKCKSVNKSNYSTYSLEDCNKRENCKSDKFKPYTHYIFNFVSVFIINELICVNLKGKCYGLRLNLESYGWKLKKKFYW